MQVGAMNEFHMYAPFCCVSRTVYHIFSKKKREKWKMKIFFYLHDRMGAQGTDAYKGTFCTVSAHFLGQFKTEEISQAFGSKFNASEYENCERSNLIENVFVNIAKASRYKYSNSAGVK